MPPVDGRGKLGEGTRERGVPTHVEEVFSYQQSRDGTVFISWHGKQVTVLSGKAAQRFVERIAALEGKEAQLVMAKVTGNFKRGNER